jgi:hypothetical protein
VKRSRVARIRSGSRSLRRTSAASQAIRTATPGGGTDSLRRSLRNEQDGGRCIRAPVVLFGYLPRRKRDIHPQRETR